MVTALMWQAVKGPEILAQICDLQTDPPLREHKAYSFIQKPILLEIPPGQHVPQFLHLRRIRMSSPRKHILFLLTPDSPKVSEPRAGLTSQW